MRLMFVGNVAWDMWNFRKDLMHALADDGYTITVLAPADASNHLLEEKFEFLPLKNLSRKSQNPFRDLKLLKELFSIYRKKKPDLIIHYTIKPNIFGALASFLAGIPSISVVAGMGYLFTHPGFATILTLPLYRLATSLNRRVLFLNQEDLQDFVRWRMLKPVPGKAIVLPGEGVNTKHFARDSQFRFQSSGRGQFLFVGRLLLDKGILYFLQAAKEVKREFPDCTFAILGPLDKGNPQCISDTFLNSFIEDGVVSYLGSTTDVRPYMSKADVIVLPTYYGEGMPRSILEAMSLGKPVITTNVRGCTALVRDGFNGYIVPKKDAKALAESMKRFLSLDSEKRDTMGRASEKLAREKFRSEIVHENYRTIIRSLVNGDSSGKLTNFSESTFR